MQPKRDRDSITVAVPTPRPLAPLEVKAVAIQEYTGKAKRLGRDVSSTAIERYVLRELELAEAGKRDSGMARFGSTRKVRTKRRAHVDQRAAQASEHGLQTWEPGGKARPDHIEPIPQVTSINPLLIDRAMPGVNAEMWASATARFARIVEAGLQRSLTIEEVVDDRSPIAMLAQDALALLQSYKFRRAGRMHNGIVDFRGMTDRNASRKYIAEVFKLCDRSTGVLGHWWVK